MSLVAAGTGGVARADHAHDSPAAAVLKALSGATVEGEDGDGRTYRIRYLDGGRATLERAGAPDEAGTWSVDARGHYCEAWAVAFGGERRCTGVEIVGPLIVLRGPFATTRTVIGTAGETGR